MWKLLLKKQWKSALCILLFFGFILFLRTDKEADFEHRYYDAQTEYLAAAAALAPDALFEKIDADCTAAGQLVDDIRNFKTYEDGLPQTSLDPLLAAAGAESYVNYEMVVWREEMLGMPGRFAATVFDDSLMLSQLAERLKNQKHFQANYENNLEVLRRAIRRGDEDLAGYKAAYNALRRVKTDFPVSDTIFADALLAYFESDIFILILMVLCNFSLFSMAAQNKITNTIRVSKMGLQRYALHQIAAAAIITAGFLLLYFAGIIVIFSNGNLRAVPWALPIQAVNGYENVVFPLSVGGYFAVCAGFKTIFLFLLVGVALFLSLCAKNMVVSAIFALALCGGLIGGAGLADGAFSALLTGGSKPLFADLPYFCFGDTAVPYAAVYAAVLALAGLLVYSAVVALAGPLAKRRVI